MITFMTTFEEECISMMEYALVIWDVVPDSQVPEPSSLALPVLGFSGLSGVIRCKEISGRG